MAAPNMHPMLVILLLASTSRMIFTTFAISTFETWYKKICNYAPIKTSNSKILDDCKKHISIKCTREVGESIFEGGTITYDCCHKLVSVGKNCHALFFNSALQSIPNVDKSRALAKSTQVWNRCVGIALSPTSSITIPNSKGSKLKIVDECRKHISIKCAREVGGSIFKSMSVTYGCCYELVSAGVHKKLLLSHPLSFSVLDDPLLPAPNHLGQASLTYLLPCVPLTSFPAPSPTIHLRQASLPHLLLSHPLTSFATPSPTNHLGVENTPLRTPSQRRPTRCAHTGLGLSSRHIQ
ncbi:unnamed protein product, partial [Prunus brigantina]